MKVIIGCYRADRDMIERCVQSLFDHVFGITGLVFVDDSGDDEFVAWLQRYGPVQQVAMTNKGYARAMEQVCNVMIQGADDYYCFWEEDFIAVEDVDLKHLADELDRDPTLAQVVLVRQPWYENEKERGDVIAAMADRLDSPILVEQGVHEKLWVHQATFSTNPAVWAPMAYRHGWPQVEQSETEKTRYLVEDDEASFAFFGHRVRVYHDGERKGRGY